VCATRESFDHRELLRSVGDDLGPRAKLHERHAARYLTASRGRRRTRSGRASGLPAAVNDELLAMSQRVLAETITPDEFVARPDQAAGR
jgi:hypothetical protein